METVGTTLRRIFAQPPHVDGRARFDEAGYRLDCCDECPIWSYDRRAVVQHRVHCDTFASSVLGVRSDAR